MSRRAPADADEAEQERLDFRFLSTGPWIFGLVFCLLFAFLCHYLAQWQWDRRIQVMEQVNRVLENYDDPATAYAEDPAPLDAFTPEQEWTPMTFTGEYLEDQTLIVRNRPRAGRPGYEVLVPFRTDQGTVVVVNRGWLPIGNAPGRPDSVPAPHPDVHTVTGRLRPGEPALDRDAPEGQIASIDLVAVADRVGGPVAEDAYVQMTQESPEAATLPQKQVEPTLDEGPHLSYALQWYLFAAMGFIVWGYSARARARNDRQDRLEGWTEEDGVLAARRPRRAVQRPARGGRVTDEEAEDAAVDAWDGAGR